MKSFLVLLITLALSIVSNAQDPLISAGAAKSRKSTLAFPEFNDSSLSSNAKLAAAAKKIKSTTESALDFSNYFELMQPSAFLEDTKKVGIKPLGNIPNGFKFDTWKQIGTEFLIRGSFEQKSSDIQLEIFVYQVAQGTLKLGKKYNSNIENAEQIGFVIANDILEAVTGVSGPFNSKLVATTDQSGNKEVVVMNWNGSDRTVVTSERNVALSPNWSPDTKQIIYSLYTKRKGSPQQNVSMYLHNLETKKRTLLSNRNGTNSGGSFHPDGKSVVLTISRNGNPDLFRINLNGDQISQLTRGPAGAMNVEAAVSPDGTKIAFSSDRSGKQPMIYVMNIDGSNVKRLTFRGDYNSTPSWSPDGKKIAFAGQDGSFTDIFVMNSDGSNIERVTQATKKNGRRASNEDPTFSPDGRFVAYISNRDGNWQIYTSTIDGEKEQRVTNDSYNYFKPKWSQNLR